MLGASNDLINLLRISISLHSPWYYSKQQDIHHTAFIDQALHVANYVTSVNNDMVNEMNLTLISDAAQNITLQEIDLTGIVPAHMDNHEPAIAQATVNYAASLI